MLRKSLEEKVEVFSRLKTEFQTLMLFIMPNEAGRIKARFKQIGRYQEEFKSSVEQREAELQSSLRNKKQFTQDLNEVPALYQHVFWFLKKLCNFNIYGSLFVHLFLSCFPAFKVEGLMTGLQEKLNVPITSCISASRTYKTLHEHMVSITMPETFIWVVGTYYFWKESICCGVIIHMRLLLPCIY